MDVIILNCENSSSIKIHNISIIRTEFKASVEVTSDWYKANINFHTSITELQSFKTNLDKLIVDRKGAAQFLNLNGNFELNCSVDDFTDGIEVNGILIKNMMDDARIDYVLRSNFESLRRFCTDLNDLLIN